MVGETIFCGHNILTEGVFVTGLCIDVKMWVRPSVWATTNCSFMSHILLLPLLRHMTNCYNIHAPLQDTSSTRLLVFNQKMLYYHLLAIPFHFETLYYMISGHFMPLRAQFDNHLFLRRPRVPYRDAVTTENGVCLTHTKGNINLGMTKRQPQKDLLNHRKYNQKSTLVL